MKKYEKKLNFKIFLEIFIQNIKELIFFILKNWYKWIFSVNINGKKGKNFYYQFYIIKIIFIILVKWI